MWLTMDIYQYSPLPEGHLRLLSLIPGPPSAEITIIIHYETLQGKSIPFYEALSYAWGARTEMRTIKVRNNTWDTSSRALVITESLEIALRHLRKEDETQALWVDAICINQEDLEERSQQVSRMGEIYHDAAKVIVWLGESNVYTEETFRCLELLGRSTNVNWQIPDLSDSAKPVEDCCFDCSFPPSFKEGFTDILNRTWFSRLWVWQEVCRARNALLVCGVQIMNWQWFSKAVVHLHQQVRMVSVQHPYPKGLRYEQMIPKMMHLMRLVEESNDGRQDLWRLLANTQLAQCSDPRDRIYAQLSMLPDALRTQIQPNYRKSTREVYLDVFLAWSSSGDEKNLLGQCGERESSSRLGIPSWLPDWSSRRRPNWFMVPPLVQACGQSAREQSYEGDYVLFTKGVRVSSITELSKVVPDSASYMEVFEIWRRWGGKILEGKMKMYPGGGNLADAYCTTLVCNYLRNSYPENTHWASLSEAREVVKHLSCENKEHNKLFNQAQYTFLSHVVIFDRNRRFFTAANGYIGLGPADLESGDIVSVLLGLRLPMILRPCGSGNYKIVGTCYVHGIMTGEALLGPLPDGWHAEVRAIGETTQNEHATEKLYFVREASGERTQQDPRLWGSPQHWDKSNFDGEDDLQSTMKTKPNLMISSDTLQKSGIKIETFALV